MEVFNENLSKVDTYNGEIYIYCNSNISLWQDSHYLFQKVNLLSVSQSVSNDVQNYFEFCSVWPKQLIESPTRITCKSSIINQILASFPDRVTKRGILNVGLSDHQLNYGTIKITKIKRSGHREIKYRSFKNYTFDCYEKAVVEINIPEYKSFDNVHDTYSNFIRKLMEIIDKTAPVKNKRIKRNSQKWFDSEISEKLIIRDKHFEKYRKSRLHKRFIKEHHIVSKISMQIRNKLKECIGWKTIKSPGLLNKSGVFAENQIVKHDTKSILKLLKAFIKIWQGIYCQNLRSCQIDIQLILPLITTKNFHYLKMCLKTDCLSY